MARAARRASSLLPAPVTLTVISLVAPSPPRTMPMASVWQTARSASMKSATFASVMRTPDAPLASANTQSFVEHSPSTVMALNVSSTAALSARCSSGRFDHRVRRHESQHRRHHRLDHAGALGDAADAERRAATGRDDGFDRCFLRKRIGRHDRDRRCRPARRRERGRGVSDPATDLRHVELHANHAGRRDEHFLRRHPKAPPRSAWPSRPHEPCRPRRCRRWRSRC